MRWPRGHRTAARLDDRLGRGGCVLYQKVHPRLRFLEGGGRPVRGDLSNGPAPSGPPDPENQDRGGYRRRPLYRHHQAAGGQ